MEFRTPPPAARPDPEHHLELMMEWQQSVNGADFRRRVVPGHDFFRFDISLRRPRIVADNGGRSGVGCLQIIGYGGGVNHWITFVRQGEVLWWYDSCGPSGWTGVEGPAKRAVFRVLRRSGVVGYEADRPEVWQYPEFNAWCQTYSLGVLKMGRDERLAWQSRWFFVDHVGTDDEWTAAWSALSARYLWRCMSLVVEGEENSEGWMHRLVRLYERDPVLLGSAHRSPQHRVIRGEMRPRRDLPVVRLF
jgi:hypothetical protein